MKENKFKDIKGLEDTQYFNQLDTFELKSTLGSFDNRAIFDLAIENAGRYDLILNDSPIPLYSSALTGSAYFKNLTSSNGYQSEQYLFQLIVVAKNKLIQEGLKPVDGGVENSNVIYTPLLNYNKTKKIDNETDVYRFEENAMFYIQPSAFNFAARSGYFEISFKTNKQNCFIATGAAEGTESFVKRFFTGADIDDPSYIGTDYMYLNEPKLNLSDIFLNIKNGKLELVYRDLYNENKKEIVLDGNANVADGEWHHIVVNFGKPGTIRQHGYKYNNRFIEMWVDGQLDFRTSEYINNEQMFFPYINYMLINPYIAKEIDGVEDNGWETFDDNRAQGNTTNPWYWAGLNEFDTRIFRGVWNTKAETSAFNGSIDTIAIGMNRSLSKFQIQQRYRLWKNFETTAVKPFIAKSNIVQPQITTNSKKALKLFWNNLINENCKNGIELDNNFQTDSYSITHKILNSLTEVNNIDLSNKKQLKFLKDVKVALKDNVVLWGPGKDFVLNNSHATDVTFPNVRQFDARNMTGYDEIHEIYRSSDPGRVNPSFEDFWTNRYIINLPISGITLSDGDRILLTNQFNKTDNGIYIFNGMNNLITRADDALSPNMINNSIVRVVDGYYKDTSWCLANNIESFLDNQNWIELEYHPNEDNFSSQPLFGSRWTNQNGIERFIDLEQDINISKYDVITFMNYPDTNEEIKEHFIGYDDFEINVRYKNFIKSLQNVVANGASLFISSPKLATDMGIIKKFTLIDQKNEESDLQSASISPFEINELSTQYFDTHRNNKYHLTQEIAGLTNKETYVLVDFINYIPENVNSYEQYHAKYSYRQLGLKEGNEFFIPSLTLRKVTENDKLPGFNGNRKGLKPMYVIDPPDINVGTTVTKFSNTYYNNNTLQNNPYDDFISTLIVHNGQLLNGQPINGKIFINCVEDSYTMSRKDYNKAVIQQVTQNDTGENTSTAQWQYSTTRLNRLPRKINIRELTQFGQTTSTNGGGGPLIQAPSNSSNGIIRSVTDKNNINYQSDLYTTLEEERYAIQEIPVLSMTWLGLLWLAD
jgi:hypothetical protein